MIYTYECQNGHIHEVTQSIHDEALIKCIECGAVCERIITGGYIVFERKTIGAIAEQNRSKLGHYERESLDKPQQEAIQKKKDSAPWWRPGTTEPIKMPSNPQKYIEG